jgi:hypothetical protein
VDQDLKAFLEMLEARMAERDARMEARMNERFERVETEARHTRVVMEGLHDNIRLLAEGIVGTGERIDALREETTSRLEEIKGSVDMIHRVLVPRVQGLENRVKILEGHVERKNRDVLDVIRERLLPGQS